MKAIDLTHRQNLIAGLEMTTDFLLTHEQLMFAVKGEKIWIRDRFFKLCKKNMDIPFPFTGERIFTLTLRSYPE